MFIYPEYESKAASRVAYTPHFPYVRIPKHGTRPAHTTEYSHPKNLPWIKTQTKSSNHNAHRSRTIVRDVPIAVVATIVAATSPPMRSPKPIIVVNIIMSKAMITAAKLTAKRVEMTGTVEDLGAGTAREGVAAEASHQ
jgi:hypothetical protein